MLKIHLKQNIEKLQVEDIFIILKVSLNAPMMWMILFIKILGNIIQTRNTKYWLFLMLGILIFPLIKKINPIVTTLFVWGTKLHIYLVFITQSYFSVPKNMLLCLNSTYYSIMKTPNKQELQQIAFNHWSIMILWIPMKNVLQNHILFKWLILLLHQIILYVPEIIF